MSVEQKIIRLPQAPFKELQRHPNTLPDILEAFHERHYFDTRMYWRHSVIFPTTAPEMIHLDAFTLWLLTDRDEPTALCDAATCGRGCKELIGAPHGHFFAYATYYPPSTVRTIAHGLGKVADGKLEARFRAQADAFRRASKPYFADDAAILSFQRGCLAVLRSFYQAATEHQEYVLQLIV
jgi:hypothetical protein